MDSRYLRLEGLPYRLTAQEVEEFFQENGVAVEKVHLLMNRQSKPAGNGFVILQRENDHEKAMELDRRCIGDTQRYVRILESGEKEAKWHLNRNAGHQENRSLHCVRMYGLPYRVTEYEIARWFDKADVNCVDVQIFLNNEGRASGEAMAYFATEAEAQKSLSLNKEDMNGRYIDLSMDNVSVTFDNGGNAPEGAHLLRMKGVPFRATEQELKDFFKGAAECIRVKVILNKSGRPSGDAIAEFETEEDLEAAMSKDKEHIGSRFVILQKMNSKGYLNEENGGDFGANGGGGGAKSYKYAVKMQGLPYSATVEDMIDFFKPEADCINVTVLKNRSNYPSGDAIAEFSNQDDVDAALAKNRKYLGNRFVIITPYEKRYR